MVAIILAAGYATRMYPLTLNFPKPLLPVGGKPIMDWLWDDIRRCECARIYVVTNHRFYPLFCEWGNRRKDTVILDDGTDTNENRFGALRDIEYVIESEKIDDDILVLAGDNVLDFSFASFIEYFRKKNTSCVMRHFEESIEKLRKTGVCTIDEHERITGMEEKPQNPGSSWAVPPFYIYKKCDVPLLKKAIEEGVSTDAPGSFVTYLAEKSTVCAFEMPGRRFDVGSIQGYEKIKNEYRGIIR